MKKIGILIFLGLLFSSELIVDFNSELEVIENQVIDKSIKDSEYSLPFKTFLINLNEQEDVDININILSKRTLDHSQIIPNSISLDKYSRFLTESDNNDIIHYYISEPMYMRGVRIVQVAVAPYYYNEVSNEITLYESISINIDFGNSKDNLYPS